MVQLGGLVLLQFVRQYDVKIAAKLHVTRKTLGLLNL